MKLVTTAAALVTLTTFAQPVQAQVIGTFSWQTQPYCNVVSLTVIQQGSNYQLTGTDNQCGAGNVPVTGTATPVASGVALAFTVTTTAAIPTQILATISLPGLAGTWRDDFGHSGTFAPGGSSAGPLRGTTGVAVTGGNGEGVGGTICVGAGIEVFLLDRLHQPVDGRFIFIVPNYSFGQVREDGSIRTQSGNLTSVPHPSPGAYCLVFTNPQPTQAQRESTIVTLHAEK